MGTEEGSEEAEDPDMKEQLTEVFKKLDQDKNGQLSQTEIAPHETGHHYTNDQLESIFHEVDSDNDGWVTAEEMKNAAKTIGDHDAKHLVKEWVDHYEL